MMMKKKKEKLEKRHRFYIKNLDYTHEISREFRVILLAYIHLPHCRHGFSLEIRPVWRVLEHRGNFARFIVCPSVIDRYLIPC